MTDNLGRIPTVAANFRNNALHSALSIIVNCKQKFADLTNSEINLIQFSKQNCSVSVIVANFIELLSREFC